MMRSTPTLPPLRADENPIAKRRRAKRGEGDLLREEILEAAEQLLIETGDDEAVSIRAVADRVGCTPPAIYMHFIDKSELMFDVCARHFLLMSELVIEAGAAETDPLKVVAAETGAFIRFGLQNPEHYRILFMGKPIVTPEQWNDITLVPGVAGFTRLISRCQECIDTGVVRVRDAHLMAVGIWAFAHGIVSLMIAKPNFSWPDVDLTVEHLITTHMAGLRCA